LARHAATESHARRQRARTQLLNNTLMFALGAAAMAAWCHGMGYL
jgi:hypothetical protein